MKLNSRLIALSVFRSLRMSMFWAVTALFSLFLIVPSKALAHRLSYREAAQILGVDTNSSEEEIKKVYRKLSMKYHPDRGGGAAEEEKFKAYKEAYERLKFSHFNQYEEPYDPNKLKQGESPPPPTDHKAAEAKSNNNSNNFSDGFGRSGGFTASSRNDRRGRNGSGGFTGSSRDNSSGGYTGSSRDNGFSGFTRSSTDSGFGSRPGDGVRIIFLYGNHWMLDYVVSFNNDGSVTTTSYTSIFNYSRLVNDSPLNNRLAIIHDGYVSRVERIQFAFENDAILTYSNSFVTDRRHYSLADPNSPYIGRKILVRTNRGNSVETVTDFFEDGTVLTANSNAYRINQFSWQDITSNKIGKKVLVSYSDGTRRTEVVTSQFNDGTVATNLNPNGLHPSYLTYEIEQSILKGQQIMVRYPNHWRFEIVTAVFADGSVSTNLNNGLSPLNFTKQRLSSQLVGRYAMIRYNNLWSAEKITMDFENGMIKTDQSGNIYSSDMFSVERIVDPLAGKIVAIHSENGWIQAKVLRTFEDGSLQVAPNLTVRPHTFAMEILPAKAHQYIAIRNGDKSAIVSQVKIAFANGFIVDRDDHQHGPDSYEVIVSSQLVGKLAVINVKGKWSLEKIIHVTDAGSLITEQSKFVSPKEYILPIESELVGRFVKIKKISVSSKKPEKVLAVFEDGSAYTQESGIVKNFSVIDEPEIVSWTSKSGSKESGSGNSCGEKFR